MPSIIFKKKQNPYFTSGLILLCSGILMACGGDSDPTPKTSPPAQLPPSSDNDVAASLSLEIPMEVKKVKLEVYVAGVTQPVYQQDDFSGFKADLPKALFNQYKNKVIVAKIIGNEKSTMYDPVLDETVPFNGTLHHVAVMAQKLNLIFTPASEAVYQRTIVRSSQFDFEQPDLTLIQSAHINKAISEVRTSTYNPFADSKTLLPYFQNKYSITTLKKNDVDIASYNNLFISLGYLQYFKEKFPETKNTYLELAHSLGTDLRDGYLDGRSIKGDTTMFNALVQTPMNTDVYKNTYLKISETQRNARVSFGNQLKDATLRYANGDGFQNTLYPIGISHLNNFTFYINEPFTDSLNNFRQLGAGDYRPAFGLTTTESCSNGHNPCRQGLNMDDLATDINDAAYLIGTHQLNQCLIHFYPSGQVSITKGDKIYRSSINRDLSDNLQQINNDPTHYILNVGASENKPAYFLQFEIKDMNIVTARTGYNYDIYSTTLETSEMDCAN